MSKDFKPHLACDADLTKTKYPVMVFPKVDGVRGMHVLGHLTGRSLKKHESKHITALYSHPLFAGFDGEFTSGLIHENNTENLCSRTSGDMARHEGAPEMSWGLFDYLTDEVIDLPYITRMFKLQDFYARHYLALIEYNIYLIPYTICHTQAEVEALYEKYLEEGFEGVVLRDPNGMHKNGRATAKSGAYGRLKPQSDKEARVIRIVEAMHNLNEAKINELGHTERSSHKENKVGAGRVGMFQCIDLETGMDIDVGPGKMKHDEAKHYWENPNEIVDHIIKYRSMDTGVKDKPRFARFMSVRSRVDMS